MKSRIVNILISFFLLLEGSVYGQHLVSATELGILPAAFITFFGITNAEYNVRYYRVTYHTTDLQGTATIASGMIAVPLLPKCDSVPIALYAHSSVLDKTNVPSNDNSESDIGKAIASRGFVVAMPDYLGLGISPGFHTYQHWETEATVCKDILLAAKEFMTDSLMMNFSNEVFLTGYSQGGHAAMATAKYIQDNNLIQEIPIAGLAPMSGAYHLSKRQTDVLLLDEPFNYQTFVVYLILSYQNIYGGIFNSYSDFLIPPYDTIIPPMFDGSHRFEDVNTLLPTKVSQYIAPTFLSQLIADSSSKSGSFWKALLDNDNFNWIPSFAVNLLYCNDDDLVLPQNSIDAYQAMTANSSVTVSKTDVGNYNHNDCAIPATTAAINYFQTIRTDCKTINNIEHYKQAEKLEVFPNPASSYLTVRTHHSEETLLEVYNVAGKMIHSTMVRESRILDVSNWIEGIYMFKIRLNDGTEIRKVRISK